MKLNRNLCLTAASSASFAAGPPARPNVLLICVDDLKPLLGRYGSPLIQSPNVDRLAARGALLESAFCNQSVCLPSRNSFSFTRGAELSHRSGLLPVRKDAHVGRG